MGYQVSFQQPNAWRSGDGERAWLSTLIETMERVSREQALRPDERSMPCDVSAFAAFRTQLSFPATPRLQWQAQQPSEFSLWN